MARVICTLENASTLISGVAFVESKGQMISEEIGDEVAAFFTTIAGYVLVGSKKGAASPDGSSPPTPAA